MKMPGTIVRTQRGKAPSLPASGRAGDERRRRVERETQEGDAAGPGEAPALLRAERGARRLCGRGARLRIRARSRGSTHHAVTAQPSPVSRNVDAIISHQLAVAATLYSGFTRCAPAVLNSARIGSRLVMKRFAQKPPATPAKAAARPASGGRPTARKSAAATGGSTT